jgi:hypothetical protein
MRLVFVSGGYTLEYLDNQEPTKQQITYVENAKLIAKVPVK